MNKGTKEKKASGYPFPIINIFQVQVLKIEKFLFKSLKKLACMFIAMFLMS